MNGSSSALGWASLSLPVSYVAGAISGAHAQTRRHIGAGRTRKGSWNKVLPYMVHRYGSIYCLNVSVLFIKVQSSMQPALIKCCRCGAAASLYITKAFVGTFGAFGDEFGRHSPAGRPDLRDYRRRISRYKGTSILLSSVS